MTNENFQPDASQTVGEQICEVMLAIDKAQPGVYFRFTDLEGTPLTEPKLAGIEYKENRVWYGSECFREPKTGTLHELGRFKPMLAIPLPADGWPPATT